MSTINAKDSSRPYVAGSNKNRTMNQTAWDNREQKDFKSNGARNKKENAVSGSRDNRGVRPGGNGGYKEKKPYGAYGKNSHGSGYGFHKDEDDEDGSRGKNKYSGGQRGDVKAKSAQNKEKELQSDKLETIKRLEKEKKALERKNQELEKEKEKQSKPPVKKRRSGSIDWAKGYAKGLYGDDDEEDYTGYF